MIVLILPENLYQTWVSEINSGGFAIEKVTYSLQKNESSISLEAGEGKIKGLFSSSTIDFKDTALGSSLNERSKNIQALIMFFVQEK